MKITYNISPAVIDWIVTQLGTNTTISDSLDTLKAWQVGEKSPTYNEIESISKKTHIPFGYFFLKTPPKENIKLMEYRTIDSSETKTPSRNLLDTIFEMEQIVDWTREYLIGEDFEENPIVGKQKNVTDITIISNYVREVLNLPINWFENTRNSFNYLRDKMSAAGVIIMTSGIVRNNTHRVLDINEFRAFTIIDKFAPLIFINATDSTSGKLFSLLHEFVHICLGTNNLFNAGYSFSKEVSKIEKICNAVTAEILVPTILFEEKWDKLSLQDKSIEKTIKDVARFFRCGSIVVARKALDRGKIKQETYNQIVQDAIKHYYEQIQTLKKGGGNFYVTKASRLDKRFLTFVVDSLSQGKTLYSEAFRLTGTNRNTFSQLYLFL